jgi:phage terminase small subunit
LNPRQQKFVELYVGGHTATEAYSKAGYKAKRDAARTNAARLL